MPKAFHNSKLKITSAASVSSVVPIFSQWQKRAKKGAVLGNFVVVLATFGAFWDKFGTVWDFFGSMKTLQNRIFCTNNAENI